jgi:alpha-tubulin suppressor-like RCC1 family protein
MPPPDLDLGGPVAQLGVGVAFSCVLMQTGAVRCWGANSYGQLGYGHTNPIGDGPGEMPPANVDVGIGVVSQLVVGAAHACVVMESGEVRCWGEGTQGQLGSNWNTNIGDGPGEMPPPNVEVGGAISDLSANRTTCALMDSGSVRCWGPGLYGLGYGNVSNMGDQPGEMPTAALQLPVGDVGSFANGSNSYHQCVLYEDMGVTCWGYGEYGQLGYGNMNNVGDGPNEMPPAWVF